MRLSYKLNYMISIIDIGTNSVILLVAQKDGHQWKAIYEESAPTRANLHAITASIERFKIKSETLGVDQIKVIGTALFRSPDGERLKAAIEKAAGLRIKVLSAKDEARYSLISALPFGTPIISIDIGGGSTDIGIQLKTGAQNIITFEGLGAVSLLEQHPLSNPPRSSEIAAMFQDVLKKVTSCNLPSYTCSVCGGTATTLAAIDLKLDKYDAKIIHGYQLPIKNIRDIFITLTSKELEQRKQIKGLESDRADIIIPGTIILICLTYRLGCDSIIVNHKGLRWGYLQTLD